MSSYGWAMADVYVSFSLSCFDSGKFLCCSSNFKKLPVVAYSVLEGGNLTVTCRFFVIPEATSSISVHVHDQPIYLDVLTRPIVFRYYFFYPHLQYRCPGITRYPPPSLPRLCSPLQPLPDIADCLWFSKQFYFHTFVVAFSAVWCSYYCTYSM